MKILSLSSSSVFPRAAFAALVIGATALTRSRSARNLLAALAVSWADTKTVVDGNHVKVFLRPAEGKKDWTARFSTLTMGDYCRPVDHGSLRDMNGRVRYRE